MARATARGRCRGETRCAIIRGGRGSCWYRAGTEIACASSAFVGPFRGGGVRRAIEVIDLGRFRSGDEVELEFRAVGGFDLQASGAGRPCCLERRLDALLKG